MPKTKVLYLVDKLIRGGGESLLLDLVTNLSKDKFQLPTILCISDNHDIKVVEEFKDIGIEVIMLNKNYNKIDKMMLKPLANIMKAMKNIKFDIIHSYSLYTNLISRILKLKYKVPIVAHHHGVAKSLPFLAKISNQLTFFLSDKIICVSKGVKESFYNNFIFNLFDFIVNEKCEIIYNPVDLKKIDNIKAKDNIDCININQDEAIIIGTVGRLAPIKGQEYLLNSIKLLKDLYPNIRLVLIGDGDSRGYLEKITKDMGLEDIVCFLGRKSRDEVFQFIKKFDVFVFPSINEGFGIALVEAMANKIPVIGTNICGVNEIIDNKKNGLLVESKDAEDLSKKIEFLINNKSIAYKFAEQGREKVEKQFSLNNIICKYENLYLDLKKY